MLEIINSINKKSLDLIDHKKKIYGTPDLIAIFAMGSQFDHLIVKCLTEINILAVVLNPSTITVDDLRRLQPRGIIISGGPKSAYDSDLKFDNKIFDEGIPLLGICLGFQMWAHHLRAGGDLSVIPAEYKEYGFHEVHRTCSAPEEPNILNGLLKAFKVLLSHGDRVHSKGNLHIIATSPNCAVTAAQHRHLYGVQFHPEVNANKEGHRIFKNFCFDICKMQPARHTHDIVEEKTRELIPQITGERLIVALSGGVDSSVATFLLHHAMARLKAFDEDGERICAIYIKGIDKAHQEDNIVKHFGNLPWIRLKIIDGERDFLQNLRGKKQMKEKRIAVRETYKKILEREIKAFGATKIIQGTIYTDISESGSGYASGADKAQIKLHHNVGLNFSIPEITPLADCVKDTVREIGKSLGVPEEILFSYPFPGPGLVVRVEGIVTRRKLNVTRKINTLWLNNLLDYDSKKRIWQAGATLLDTLVSCTKGDGASCGYVVCLWAVESRDGFTASWARLPESLLASVSQQITNSIGDIGCVTYRISDKPPATIEFW